MEGSMLSLIAWRTAAVAATLAASIALGNAAETLTTPEAAVKAFYRVYARANVMDIPDAKHRGVWRPVLTDALFGLLVLGDDAETRWAEKNKKEPAPPLYEGDLFTSMVEGSAKFDGAACQTADRQSVCTIALHFVDKSKAGKSEIFRWHDKLDLLHTEAGWRVNDLEYGGTWDFGPHGRLTDILKDVDRTSRAD
jgi:hypothetical protein